MFWLEGDDSSVVPETSSISWAFYVGDNCQSSSIHYLIISQDCLRELGIIMNFNEQTVTWYNDTILMKDRDAALYDQKRH
jgi:hypothetical protein